MIPKEILLKIWQVLEINLDLNALISETIDTLDDKLYLSNPICGKVIDINRSNCRVATLLKFKGYSGAEFNRHSALMQSRRYN
jgi:hypothetical protein